VSNLLGVIRAVIGQVYVVEADGSRRLLREGDRIFSGEEIETGDSGAVSVSLPNGQTLDLGRNSHWGEHGLQNVTSPEHATQDVAALQKAIADGTDPTQSLEATAAGNEAPVQLEGGGGGHTLVQLDLTGQVVDPTAGFKTTGIGSPVGENLLPEGALSDGDNGGSAPILPPQVYIDNFAGNDGFINKNEINHTPIDGTSNQNHVTLVFTDSQKKTMTVDVPVKDGHWTLTPDLSGLADGNVTVVATATDVAGRTAHSDSNAEIDTVGPNDTITIDSVTPDNVINIVESHQPLTRVHGNVGGDAKVGDTVTLTVDGTNYTTTVIALPDGTLGYERAVSTQGLLANPNIHAVVTSTDEAGNTTQASSDHRVDIDLDIHNAVTIGTVDGDDVVNRSESRMPVAITGVAGGDAQVGDPVVVTVGGKEYPGVVINDNGQLRYEVMVPSTALKEGGNEVTVTLTSHDAAGNVAVAVEHHTVTLDTQAQNALTIGSVAGDNTVNAIESRMPTFISGEVTGDAQAGDRVVVSVNGQNFYGEVVTDENGHLRYNVPVSTSALNEGGNDVQVSITGVDAVGNTALAIEHKIVTLDTHADAGITINRVTADNTLNHNELTQPKQTLTGEVSGDARLNDAVHVVVNGHGYDTRVIDLGNGKLGYSVDVDSTAFSNNQGEVDAVANVTATVISHDDAGNETIVTAEHKVRVDNHADAGITVHTVAGYDTVNAIENLMPTFINGDVSGDAREGDRVVVTVQGKDYSGVVTLGEDGKLHYEIPVPVGGLHEGQNSVNVRVYSQDDVGNNVKAETHTTVTLDTQASNHLTIDTVAGDNTVNAIESRMPTFISGGVTGDAQAGDRVVVSVNGQNFYGEVVTDKHGQLRYEVPVPTGVLNEGGNDVQVSITGVDAVGNTALAIEHKIVILDTHADAGITIDTISGNNILNYNELTQPKQTLTGEVSGDARLNDAVHVVVNGHGYDTRVIDLGNGKLGYSVDVDSTAFSNNQGEVDAVAKVIATVTSHDDAGNETIVTTEHKVRIDNHADAGISVHTVADDDTVNAIENRMPTLINGEVNGDAREGDRVVVTVQGKDYSGTVTLGEDGKLHYEVPVPVGELHEGQNSVDVRVYSHDDVGNNVKVEAHTTVTLDTQARNHLTIDTVAGDNTVNAIESRLPTLISGGVSGDAQAGDRVEVVVHGKHFYGEVVTDEHGQLRYEVPVPGKYLHEGHNNVRVTVTGVDAAGNTAMSIEHKIVTLDTHAHAGVTIDTIGGDFTLNHNELTQPKQTLTGEVSGDARVNDAVHVVVNGHGYDTRVIDLGNGKLGYSVDVDSTAFSDNQGKIDTNVKVVVTLTSHDDAGNETIVTTEHKVHIDNHADAGITVNTVANQNIVNAHENRMPTFINGDVSGDAREGDRVVVTVQGKDYSGLVTLGEDGKLHYEIPVPVGGLHEGQNSVDVRVYSHDDVGNNVKAEAHTTVTLDTHADATITLEKIAGNDRLNYDELDMPKQTLTGEVGGDARVHDTVNLLVNGHPYTTEVITLPNGKLGYSITVNSSDFYDNHASVDKNVPVSVTVFSLDDNNNQTSATTTHNVHIDNHAGATITIDSVTGDGMINGKEAGQETIPVTGTVSGDVHVGDNIFVVVNGHFYPTSVIKLDNLNGQLGYKVDVTKVDMLDTPTHTPDSAHIIAYVGAHDGDGNVALPSATQDVTIDLKADAEITLDPIDHNDIINAADAQQLTTVVSGTVGGDAKEHDIVTLKVNGNTLHGEVVKDSSGHLVYHITVSTNDLLEDPNVIVSIDTTDKANNSAHAELTRPLVIDTEVVGDVKFDNVTPDNVLNGEELKQKVTMVSGTLTGEMHSGEAIVLTVNGVPYPGHVEDLGHGNMGFHILVNTTDLQHNPDIQLGMSVTDGAGNHRDITAVHHVDIDDHADVSATINMVAGDNVLNGEEQKSDTTLITGRVSGDVHAGEYVHLMINGHLHDVIIEPQTWLGGGLGYSYKANTADLLADPRVTVSVDGKDAALNTAHFETSIDVTRDDSAVASITIDNVAVDDVINNQEAHQDYTTITGTVSGDVHPGDSVELNVNGYHYFGNVITTKNGLGYSIDVSTRDLLEVKTPHINAQITGVDLAGNHYTASVDHDAYVDTRADAHITLDSVEPNNPIGTDFWIVKGHVSGEDVQVGDDVQIKIGDKTFHATVTEMPDGKLGYIYDQYGITPDVMKTHPDVTVTITGTDPFGNTMTDSATKSTGGSGSHDNGSTTPHARIGDAFISPVGDHDAINKAVMDSGKVVIHGTVSGDIGLNDKVIVTIDGKPYPGHIVALPNLPGELGFEAEVDTKIFNADGKFDISVQVTDANGQAIPLQHEAHRTVVVDTHVDATIHLDPIAGDNVINIEEAKSGTTTLSGTVTGDVHPGSMVTIEINGNHVTAEVLQNPTTGGLYFSRDVSIDDLRADPNVKVSITAIDEHGNTTTAQDSATVHVDTDIAGHIQIDSITQDNVINYGESKNGTTPISGSVSGDLHPGDEITLYVNGQKYHTTVDDTLHFHKDVKTTDLMNGSSITATATAHDDAQNTLFVSQDHHYSLDTVATAGVTINLVSGDDVLNADDLTAKKTEVTGRVSGDMHVGDEVIISVNGHNTTAYVEELPHMNGALGYRATIKTDDFKFDQHGNPVDKPQITATVEGKDEVGNHSGLKTAEKTLTIDDHADVKLHIDPIAGDNMINGEENKSGQFDITGSVSGDVHPGDNVVIHINGFDRNVTINDDMTFKLTVDKADLQKNGDIDYTVTGKDAAGNTLTVVEHNHVTFDLAAEATINVAKVTGDDLVNGPETHSGTFMVSGEVGGEAHVGDYVTLKLNNDRTFYGVVGEHDGKLTYEVPVDATALRDGTNNVDVSITVRDAAGNTVTKSASHTFTADTHADATVKIDNVTGDNHLTAREVHHPLTHITGTMGGDVQDGDAVSVNIGDKHFDGTVHLVNGVLTYDVAVETSALQVGENKVSVAVLAHDAHGNSTPQSQSVTVTVDAPHHAHGHSHEHSLSTLLGDSHESLSFGTHHGSHAFNGHDDSRAFTGRSEAEHQPVDLRDLAHELHDHGDLTQFIRGGDHHGPAASPAAAAAVHPVAGEMTPDSHGHGLMSYSLDHLISKPDNITH
jgi:large repetitive protein